MPSEAKERVHERADGRRPLMIYLAPDLILDLKREALEKGSHVYLLIENAMKARSRAKADKD
jgi:hypothetical protein